MADLEAAKQTLLAELREHALVIGEVTLSSGATAQYYVDARARRCCARPVPRRRRADRRRGGRGAGRGGRRAGDGGDPARLRGDRRAGRRGLVGFFVRSERKEHGLQRWVEGPVEPGARCLVVEDTVTTGGSTVEGDRADRASRAWRSSACVCGRRPPGRRRRGIEAAARRPLPRPGHDRRDLPRPPGPG